MCKIIYCRNLVHFISFWNFQGLFKIHLFNLTLYHEEVPLVRCPCEVLDHVAGAPWHAYSGEAEEAGSGWLVNTLVLAQWQLPSREGGCLSVCFLLFWTKLWPVLRGTAGAGVDNASVLVPCERAGFLLSCLLAVEERRAGWAKGATPSIFSRCPLPIASVTILIWSSWSHSVGCGPACAVCAASVKTTLMCRVVMRVRDREGQRQGKGMSCFSVPPSSVYPNPAHVLDVSFLLLTRLPFHPTGIILLSFWLDKPTLFCKLMVCLH